MDDEKGGGTEVISEDVGVNLNLFLSLLFMIISSDINELHVEEEVISITEHFARCVSCDGNE